MRQEIPTAVETPYEQLLEEISELDNFDATLHNAVEADQLPPSYYQNPSYESARVAGDRDYPAPLGIFMDGVSYLKKGSLLAIWIFNLLTGMRHIPIILKKDLLCTCGCRGWCTLYRVFEFIRRSLDAAAQGVYALRRHDNSAWPEGDRKEKAGTRMPQKLALMWCKVDWSEIAVTLGFKSWSTRLWPCYCCFTEKSEMNNIEDSFAEELPWARVQNNDYEAACRACEIDITIPDRHTHTQLYWQRWNWIERSRALVGGLWWYPYVLAIQNFKLEIVWSRARTLSTRLLLILCDYFLWWSGFGDGRGRLL